MSALKVLLIAEGPSEFGCLDNPYRSASGDEGYFPPMLRKVLDRPLAIDAQSVMRIGRFDQKAKLKGHADRAASALLIASQYDYELLVFVKDVDRRWLITFPFGLVHGFGFAGALSEIAVSRADLPVALGGFNVGVEAGQLAVLFVVLPVLAWLRTRAWFSVHGVRTLSGAIAAIGVWLFVVRVW